MSSTKVNVMQHHATIADAHLAVRRPGLRQFFWYLNHYVMAPAFRLGLGPLLTNPLTGYIMVLTTIGAKTGKVRYTPLNYAIVDGQVYCIAGWGQSSHWYRNLRAHSGVACILPGETLVGVAEAVDDPDEALRAIRQVLRNAGFVGFVAGLNPFTISDQRLREKTQDAIVIRVRLTGVAGGPADPGGWFWVVSLALHMLVLRALLRRRGGRSNP
jgi:deazaflavin-dependent oxidoreductase (nitroreductase family)